MMGRWCGNIRRRRRPRAVERVGPALTQVEAKRHQRADPPRCTRAPEGPTGAALVLGTPLHIARGVSDGHVRQRDKRDVQRAMPALLRALQVQAADRGDSDDHHHEANPAVAGALAIGPVRAHFRMNVGLS